MARAISASTAATVSTSVSSVRCVIAVAAAMWSSIWMVTSGGTSSLQAVRIISS